VGLLSVFFTSDFCIGATTHEWRLPCLSERLKVPQAVYGEKPESKLLPTEIATAMLPIHTSTRTRYLRGIGFHFLALILALDSVAVSGVDADVYSYKDKDGVLQFTTSACVYFEKVDASWSAPAAVKVFGILYQTDKSVRSGRLNEVVFSIHNASDRTLQCVKVGITVRNPRREIIHQQESVVDVFSAAVPAGSVRQVRQWVGIDGFELNKQRGDVTIVVLSARFTE